MKYNVLALDGGGMRGVITAVWLAEIERLIRRPLHTVIDLVAGTSTGSILAATIASGTPVFNVIDMYRKSGPVIFPSGLKFLSSKVKRVLTQGISNPKYDGKGLEKELKKELGDAKMCDLKIKTMFVSYDAFEHKSLIFKSWSDKYCHIPVWKAVKASASAPTYFPATNVIVDGVNCVAVDGGLVDNNPAGCALAEALRICDFAQQDIYLASFGTGMNHVPVTTSQGQAWGATQWLIPLLDAFMDGSASAAEYLVGSVLDNSDRVQMRLPQQLMAMDDPSLTGELIIAAQDFAHQNQELFKKIAANLLKDR